MKKLVIAVAVSLLGGCASNSVLNPLPGVSETKNIAFEELYLRGVFNWWEASSGYQLQRGNSSWYVDVELIADGQPYDFKLADAVWSPAQTCGGKYKGQPATLSGTTYLVCGSDAENVQFVPATTATYRFSFARASANEIRLDISRAPQ